MITLKNQTKVKRDKIRNLNYLTTGEKITSPEELERISISRTKRNIKEICLCNDFEYFVTLTINSELCDRFSLIECQDKVKKLFKQYKRNNKDFKYILITEEHKKGAFHFHGMFKGCGKDDLFLFDKKDFDKLPYYILDSIEKGEDLYYSKYFFDNLGWCTLSKIKNQSKCSTYITKYISKNCIKNDKNQIYFCSRGLKKCGLPDIMLPAKAEDFLNFFGTKRIIENNQYKRVPKYFENEFCICCDFNLDLLSKEQLKHLYYYFCDSNEFSPDNFTYFVFLIKLMLKNKFKIDIDNL